jgi:uncharacterized MAPEG superfamily protein
LWVPYILDRLSIRGFMGTMANPSPRDKSHSPWATRLLFAHMNTIENLVIFGFLVLVLAQLDISNRTTVLASATFFWSRLAYVVIYTLGIPVLRTLAFAVGFVAQVTLALAIFRVV